MALDATVGGANADSYLSVAAADLLASADVGRAATTWAALTTTTDLKERALKRATREIDAFLRTSGAARFAATQLRLYPRAVDAASSLWIVSSSAAAASVITTRGPHGFTSGQTVVIAGHTGSTPSLNGSHVVTVTGETTFTIPVTVSVAGSGGTLTNASVNPIPYIPSAVRLATWAQAKFLNAGGANVIDAADIRSARQMQSASEPNISYSQEEGGAAPFLCAEAKAHLQGAFGGAATIRSVAVGTSYSAWDTTDLVA